MYMVLVQINVFGSNPNLPNNMDSRLPDHEGKTSSEIVAKNLNAMHSAWKALIKSESNEQIRQALCHQTEHLVIQNI